MRKIIFGVLSLGFWGIFSFNVASANEIKINGEIQTVGSTTLQPWVFVDEQRALKSLGVSIPASQLNQLPHTPFEVVLKLPSNIDTRPFRHVTVDWNPHGHEPGFYEVPHFDIHFYMMTLAKRLKITCQGSDAAVCMKPVPPQQIPNNYVPTPAGVPKMGWHYVDTTSPEFHGGPFTSTMIYGYYGGRMTFLEPMIALSYLQTRPQFTRAIAQPATYPERGYYPTEYSVKYNAVKDQFDISLNKMVFRR